ncbi:MAG TPA: hypothetical protein VKW08_09905 [Xanthobacteraceae bacterium]|nr:hypothetical protein [Xanthobacteraceae bacterium]
MARSEFFFALFFIGCFNGLGARAVDSIRSQGWSEALLSTFGVSGIVWVACFKGLELVLREPIGKIRLADLGLGVLILMLVSLPIGGLSWLAVSMLGVYVLLQGAPTSTQRRGVIILLAVTVPMLWSRILFRYFANLILEIDAKLVGLILGTQNAGNIVPFADHSGSLIILPYCSSLANVSLAFLTWVLVTQWLSRRWAARDLRWCFLAGASVVAFNVSRISLMGRDQAHYELIHSQYGDLVGNLLLLSLMIGICLFGARRDLLTRS